MSPKSACVPHASVASTHQHTQLFDMGVGDRTQDPMLVWQVLYGVSCHSSLGAGFCCCLFCFTSIVTRLVTVLGDFYGFVIVSRAENFQMATSNFIWYQCNTLWEGAPLSLLFTMTPFFVCTSWLQKAQRISQELCCYLQKDLHPAKDSA